MNERILELFVQALEEFKAENKYATIIVPNPLQEKFAELIVRECMEQLNISNVPTSISAGLNLGRVAIKEHFGVRE